MNIATATLYAKHGYSITRNTWKKNGIVTGKLHEHNGLLCDGDEYIILSTDDLVADDWELVIP